MSDAPDDPRFRIPVRPQRRFSSTTVEHDGGVVFALVPEGDHDDDALDALVTRVLDDGPYRYGDWFDLPLPLYLVHDDGTGDTFRVVVRDGAVELHPLPETESAGLRALYDRLLAATDSRWAVERRADA
ncbi:hypothetical protein [Halomarina pelagica]|uniref:hypothetical protein n=1 Tax=Halomarina pelagica TaxID=2961599 RepID=UPI0020C57600|nr:hypothetical protein [Halomarina sp. BND7]